MKKINLLLIILIFSGFNYAENSTLPEYQINKIVNAIYKAEGSEKAKKPFGILSVPCNGYDDCREICFNTVRNTFGRWKKSNNGLDFISFLGMRYAPIGAGNDPNNLNQNWIKNVKYFLKNGR